MDPRGDAAAAVLVARGDCAATLGRAPASRTRPHPLEAALTLPRAATYAFVP